VTGPEFNSPSTKGGKERKGRKKDRKGGKEGGMEGGREK
jgi:hypothetical protein